MKKRLFVMVTLMLCLSWMACHRDDKNRAIKPKVAVVEITLDRQKVAARLVKEAEVPLDLGWHSFMPVRSDKSVYVRCYIPSNEIRLQRYGFDLSQVASNLFRHGQGPGEWVDLPEFVGFDDTILMIDSKDGRITWLDGQMKIVRTLRHTFKLGLTPFFELVYGAKEEFGIYCLYHESVRMERGYYSGYNIKVLGGKINPKRLDCEVYYEAFVGRQKDQKPDYQVGEKILFAQVSNNLYIVDAETYTLTRMGLDGVPIRTVRVETERPEFSKEILQKWAKPNSKSRGQWKPTYLYPSPLWPVVGIMPLGKGLAVIVCEDYDPENKPEMLKADLFDLDLNSLGVVYLPSFPSWNSPKRMQIEGDRRYLCWQKDHLFHIDYDDEWENPTLSRWRLE